MGDANWKAKIPSLQLLFKKKKKKQSQCRSMVSHYQKQRLNELQDQIPQMLLRRQTHPRNPDHQKSDSKVIDHVNKQPVLIFIKSALD